MVYVGNLVFSFNINSFRKKIFGGKTMLRCIEIERLMTFVNMQADSINTIAKNKNVNIRACDLRDETPSFFDYKRLISIANIINQHSMCLEELDSENELQPYRLIGKISLFNSSRSRNLIWSILLNHGHCINMLLP